MARVLENRLPNQAEHDEQCEGGQDLFFEASDREGHGRGKGDESGGTVAGEA